MLIKNCILWPASVVVSLLLLAVVPPLAAETPSDAERLQKLEQAVETLQKRNAQLESEISGLKKTQNAFAGPPAHEPNQIWRDHSHDRWPIGAHSMRQPNVLRPLLLPR